MKKFTLTKTVLCMFIMLFVSNWSFSQCYETIDELTSANGELQNATTKSESGTVEWLYNSQYNCWSINAYKDTEDNEDWLIFTMIENYNAKGSTIKFKQAINFAQSNGVDVTKNMRCYLIDNWQGEKYFDMYTFRPLEIKNYPTTDSYNFVESEIVVPEEYLDGVYYYALCFCYESEAGKAAAWQIKDIVVTNHCDGYNGGNENEVIVESPISLPNVGSARLKVTANNVQNYYYNYDETSRTSSGNTFNYDSYNGFEEKTDLIAEALLMTNADVYALCEVEATQKVLDYLASRMNSISKTSNYVAVQDGIEVPNDSYDNSLKSGFIYRKDKVKPVGSNSTASSATYYYKYTMRIQAFEELASGGRFTIAMNHFKAGGNSSDESARTQNAIDLIKALQSGKAIDPDILILGDLNCLMTEDACSRISKAGYEEQLLKYNSNAFTYCYSGYSLIDHAFANASMASQITGADVFHINTKCSEESYKTYSYRYSDHDPYTIGIKLNEPTGLEDIQTDNNSNGATKIFHEGNIYIIVGEKIYNAMGLEIK